MRLSPYSISVGLYLFHGVFGGGVKFGPPNGTSGDVVTCTSDEYDDEILADFLEHESIDSCTRVGNNFVIDDGIILRCGDNLENEILTACEGPIGGVTTCKSASAKVGVEL
ncbi:hypothetical protein V502_08236 [Pseudogymnoascus sp. VKM F-4520 (FW-2644)]|nr:hypothetical protein V502_08236 [Pseudogymnoascus sp. VKM F-4520 (FW-2644)]